MVRFKAPLMARASKICLLGDFSVGKTSLIRRYIHDEFSLDYRATVGVQVHQYTDEIVMEKGVVPFAHVIWDIEGNRSSEDLVTNYILGAAGAIIVGDISRKDAVASMSRHAETFANILPGRPIVFAMNKSDLVEDHGCSDTDRLAEEFGGELVYTSALTGDAVKTLFHALARRVLETVALDS